MFHPSHKPAIAAAVLLLFATVGCRISSHGNSGKEDVDISTPLGGLAVKTDPNAVLGKIGLPAYPGATASNDKGNDKSSADVNLSFGSFHLRVLALGFQTGDDPDRVEAFYRKALGQYSDVITCEHDRPVGKPMQTGLGLTCEGEKHVHTALHDDSNARGDEEERVLKAGSPSRQHLVSMRALNNGTHFSLVALDLPKDK